MTGYARNSFFIKRQQYLHMAFTKHLLSLNHEPTRYIKTSYVNH
jgi:hypothetical protein